VVCATSTTGAGAVGAAAVVAGMAGRGEVSTTTPRAAAVGHASEQQRLQQVEHGGLVCAVSWKR
jgi:hypothetical protein